MRTTSLHRLMRTLVLWAVASAVNAAFLMPAISQASAEKQHQRGWLWENIYNDGWIGSLGAWDYKVSLPLGFYPGFKGYTHPVGEEDRAINTFANANFHNFRSGCWIVVKGMTVPAGPPDYRPMPADYEIYYSGLQSISGFPSHGTPHQLEPLKLDSNYVESALFDPRLPEEMTDGIWYTNTGIKVTRRSYAWGFPGYRDFIIYDYVFKNTGEIVSTITGQLVPDPDDVLSRQTLSEVYFVFHSGISVSTKSQINLYADLNAVQAGAFGWKAETYHDYYHLYDNGELVFSTNFDGGKEPTPWGAAKLEVKDNQEWKRHFGEELMSPAAFGWLALHADPIGGAPRTSPKPDVLRIDSHKNSKFQGSDLDLQFLTLQSKPKSFFYRFATTPDTVVELGNQGDRLNFYTFSYGPYVLEPDDSVRFIIAEIAGVMDLSEAVAGDPEGHFPDSSIAAIRRNAENARNAVAWGKGAVVEGIPLAADVPESPPAPRTVAVNASEGTDKPAIGVTWDDVAETTVIQDGVGGAFYDGLISLDGYRVYRSTDFQYSSEDRPTVLRGAAWSLLADIPKSEFSAYWDADLGKYSFRDTMVAFGAKYGYYVAAYRNAGASWVSANGSTVSGLPLMESGDYNRSFEVSASPGPVTTFDVFVVPNPYVYNDPQRSFGKTNPFQVQFYNLPESCVIRIYTISGDLVKTLQHEPDARGNVFGSESWDQKSESGLLVAPGLYVYHVQSTTPGLDGSVTGKLMIIR